MTKEQVQLEVEVLINLAGEKSVIKTKSLQDSLQLLRLCIIYLKFDNEAMKRELKQAQKKG